jgi:hypothetical protein
VTSNTFFIHQTIYSDLSSAPYLEWPHPIQGLINIESLEF